MGDRFQAQIWLPLRLISFLLFHIGESTLEKIHLLHLFSPPHSKIYIALYFSNYLYTTLLILVIKYIFIFFQCKFSLCCILHLQFISFLLFSFSFALFLPFSFLSFPLQQQLTERREESKKERKERKREKEKKNSSSPSEERKKYMRLRK